jgi:hypothetical protein
MGNTCALCGYTCTADDYCSGCDSYICGRHVYNPGGSEHVPSAHDAGEAERRVERPAR